MQCNYSPGVNLVVTMYQNGCEQTEDVKENMTQLNFFLKTRTKQPGLDHLFSLCE